MRARQRGAMRSVFWLLGLAALAVALATSIVPVTVRVPEKVLLPVKFWVLARIANSLEVLGSVKVRVVPVVIPDSENSAFLWCPAATARIRRPHS